MLLVILLVITLGLCCYLIYSKCARKDENNINTNGPSEEEVASYTYNELEGVYSFTTEVKLEDYNSTASATLILLKDGTFKYEQSVESPLGQLGNYIIGGNKIKLNYLFKTNSGAGVMPATGTKELVIIDTNSIEDSSVTWGKVKYSGILKRKTDVTEEYFKGIYYILTLEGLGTFQ